MISFLIIIILLLIMILLLIYGIYNLFHKCKKTQNIILYDTENFKYNNSKLRTSDYSVTSRQYHTKEEYETKRKQILNLKLP